MSDEPQTQPEPAPVATEPLTLSRLKELLPPYKDVTIDGLGVFRLHRIPSMEVLKFGADMAEIADEDGTADKMDTIAAMLGLVEKSLGGDFDTPEGRGYLRMLDPEHQLKLIGEASRVCGTDVESRNKRIEDAKKD